MGLLAGGPMGFRQQGPPPPQPLPPRSRQSIAHLPTLPPRHPSELQPLLSETADFQANDVEQLVRGLKLKKLLRELQRRGQSVIAAMKDRRAADGRTHARLRVRAGAGWAGGFSQPAGGRHRHSRHSLTGTGLFYCVPSSLG
jgi:hypothetical protein